VKYEYELTVERDERDKASAFVHTLRALLMLSGVRVQAGDYIVTIERVRKPADTEKEGAS